MMYHIGMPSSARAFTLIELLVTVSVIAVLTGFMVPGFTNYLDSQNTKQGKEQIKNDLRTIQNKAINGAGAATGILYWGVRFDDNAPRYSFFTSPANDWSTCSNPPISETSTQLPSAVVVRNGPLCVFFSFSNGGVTFVKSGGFSNQIITIGKISASVCEGVEVNTAGLIKGVALQPCELN